MGPVQLEVIPGKGLGWRATRDIATGELLLVSLPIAVLYGPPGEPPDNEELEQAMASSWARLTPLERNWLLLLGDCCVASSSVPVAGHQEAVSSAVAVASTATVPLTVMDGGQESEAAAAAASTASSSPQRQPIDMEALLECARALLAEAQQQQQQQQRVLAEEAQDAEALATVATATPGVPILPPSIFGVATAGRPRAGASGGAASSDSSSSSGRDSSSSSGDVITRGGGVVSELVRRYSYAEAREDEVVSELLDVSPSFSVTGLWPEAALFNHSCCPNAGLLLLGGAAYVRAARPVMEGEEVTVSYLGAGVFRHAAERRSRLRASHGFLCRCPRCTAEHAHFPTVRYRELGEGGTRGTPPTPTPNRTGRGEQNKQAEGQGSTSGGGATLDDVLLAERLVGRGGGSGLGGGSGGGGGALQAVLDAVFGAGRFRAGGVAPDHTLLARLNDQLAAEMEAAAQAALTAPSAPRARQAALLERLEGLLEQVEGSCSYLELPPRGRLMVLASVYGIVRLTSDLAELSGQATPERRLALLHLCAEAVEAVAPGSDAHATAAVKAAGVARRVHGADSATTRRAELAAAAAHLARYGRELLTEPALLRRMMATRRRLATGSGLAASMGVLAWLQHVGGSAE